MDERVLAERLIQYDTSTEDGIRAAVGFVKGWLESHEIPVEAHDLGERPALTADVGAGADAGAPTLVWHGHVDVVPGHPEQFAPRVEGDRLVGRGAYDMKGGLAAMMCALRDVARQNRVRVRFVCVPDEESAEIEAHATELLVAGGLRGDFALTGEPTDLYVGVQAKGVLVLSVTVLGTAAHGSTPWLGDNAVLKSHDVFRRIESLPFSRESSELFDRPSINLSRIRGGDALNKVPDRCTFDVDIRYLPNQDPAAILEQVSAIPDIEVQRTFTRIPAMVSRSNPYVAALVDAVGQADAGEAMSVGRDGASDVVYFLEIGIPAVEFGPAGAGHHGPDEWVSISSLERYRHALVDFVDGLPAKLGARNGGRHRPTASPRVPRAGR